MRVSVHATLSITEFPALHGGGIATSYCFQGAVFSPEPVDPLAGKWSFYDFERLTLIAQIADAHGLSMYYNIGAANHHLSYTGTIWFNHRYSLEERVGKPIWGSDLIERNLWAIASNRCRHVSVPEAVLAVPQFTPVSRPHFVYDPSHPDVVRLCMAHVRDFVSRFPTAKGFFLRGEGGIAHAPKSSDGARITSANFDLFAPITNFAPHLVEGFRAYMSQLLGGSVQDLRARWGIGGIDFRTIDVLSPMQWNSSHPMVANDYVDFQAMVVRELDVRHFQEAKRQRPAGWYSIFGFAPDGVERSALGSDFATTGAWIGSDEAVYIRGGGNGLALIADAARLSGKPMGFGICSSTQFIRDDLPNRLGLPSFRACFRDVAIEHVRLYFREVLTAGISHLSYVKAWGFGLFAHPPSVEATNLGIRMMRDLRQRALRFMGPFQQVAVHADSLQSIGNEVAHDRPSTYATWRLTQHLRSAQVPVAIFSDGRVLQRTFSRWHLRRSLTVVPFTERPEVRVLEYVQLLAGADAGTAVLVLSEAAWIGLQSSLGRVGGSWTRTAAFRSRRDRNDRATLERVVIPPIGSTRCHVLAFRNARPNETAAAYLDAAMRLVGEHLVYLATLGGVVLRPAFATAPGAALTANCVSDGLNFLLAVSWVKRRGNLRVPLSVQVDEAWRARFDARDVAGFDVEIVRDLPGLGKTIGPTDTRFVHVEAQLHPGLTGAIRAGGLARIIADLRAALTSLQTRFFEVSHGSKLVDEAQAHLDAGYLPRALAAAVALSRMVFVIADRLADQVVVEAATVWRAGGPGVAPVTDAEAQLVLVLNDHEVQPPVRLTNGRATLPILEPRTLRWDLDHGSRYRHPTRAEVDQVIEVHVTDLRTGGHGFVTVLREP